MKKLLIIPLLLAGLLAAGQDNNQAPAFNDLYISNAPGLMLAGKSSMTIDRPTTPRAFALNLVNLAQGGAVETAPYWWFNNNLHYMDYIKKNFIFLQTLNFSIANIKMDSSFTLAPGIRATVLRIYSKSKLAAIKAKYNEIVTITSTTHPELIDKSALEKAKKALDTLSMKGQFVIDVAFAALATSPGSSFKDLNFNRTGLWTNISWSPDKLSLNFTGLARYSWSTEKNVPADSASNYADFGVQVNYSVHNFTLTGEYVNRRDIEQRQNYFKLTAGLTYNVTDNLALIASYGKDLTPGTSILTLFGINFGFDRNTTRK